MHPEKQPCGLRSRSSKSSSRPIGVKTRFATRFAVPLRSLTCIHPAFARFELPGSASVAQFVSCPTDEGRSMRSITALFAYLLLFLFPQSAAAEQNAKVPWSAPATTQVLLEDRRPFTSGGAKLVGTLYMPRSRTPVAAIVVNPQRIVTAAHSSPVRSFENDAAGAWNCRLCL